MTPEGVLTEFALPAVPPPAGSPAGTAGTTPHPTALSTWRQLSQCASLLNP